MDSDGACLIKERPMVVCKRHGARPVPLVRMATPRGGSECSRAERERHQSLRFLTRVLRPRRLAGRWADPSALRNRAMKRWSIACLVIMVVAVRADDPTRVLEPGKHPDDSRLKKQRNLN